MQPIVKLNSQASLSGLVTSARDCAKPVMAFLGIPFAEPPDRFEPPRPLRQLWIGTRTATKYG